MSSTTRKSLFSTRLITFVLAVLVAALCMPVQHAFADQLQAGTIKHSIDDANYSTAYAVLQSDGYIYRADQNGNALYNGSLWGVNPRDRFAEVQVFFIESNVSTIDFKSGLKYKYQYQQNGTVCENSMTSLYYGGFESIHKLVFKLDASGKNACRVISTNGFVSGDGFSNLKMIDEVRNFDKTQLITTPVGCFHGCEQLVSIKLPDTLVTLSSSSFSECRSLGNVKFGKNLREIGSCAFSKCHLLGAGIASTGPNPIDIPASVARIGGGAFGDCDALQTVILRRTAGPVLAPDATYVAGNIFKGCDRLKSIYVFNYYLDNYRNNPQCKNWQEYSDKIKGWLGTTSIGSVKYNGSKQTPAVTVTWMGKKLPQKTNGKQNYSLTYSNNVKAGTGKVVVKGMNSYAIIPDVDPGWSLQTSRNFSITKAALPKIKLSATSYVYNGKVRKPSVSTTGKALVVNRDYTVKWSNASSKGVGTYTVTITGKGNYTGSSKATYKIVKAPNTLIAKGKTATVSVKAVAKKAQVVKVGKAFNITKAQGAVTYKKVSGNAKIKVAKNGKITVTKGLKAGTYKVKVSVRAAGNANYKPVTKNVVVTVKVR